MLSSKSVEEGCKLIHDMKATMLSLNKQHDDIHQRLGTLVQEISNLESIVSTLSEMVRADPKSLVKKVKELLVYRDWSKKRMKELDHWNIEIQDNNINTPERPNNNKNPDNGDGFLHAIGVGFVKPVQFLNSWSYFARDQHRDQHINKDEVINSGSEIIYEMSNQNKKLESAISEINNIVGPMLNLPSLINRIIGLDVVSKSYKFPISSLRSTRSRCGTTKCVTRSRSC